MNYFTSALKKYTDFSGRATRSEYWYFILFTFLFSIVVGLLDGLVGTKEIVGNYGLISSIYYLIIIIPSIAIAVRRLHDVNKSGWMLLISLIPIIGGIWIFILMIRDSFPGENEYGINSKIILNTNIKQTTPANPESPDNISIENTQNKSKNIKLFIFICIIIGIIIFLISRIEFCHSNKVTDHIDKAEDAVIFNNINKDFTKEDFYPIEVKESYRKPVGICTFPDGGMSEAVNSTISIFEDKEKTKQLAYFDKKTLGLFSVGGGTTSIKFFPYNKSEYEIIIPVGLTGEQQGQTETFYLKVNKLDKSIRFIKESESKYEAMMKSSMDEFRAEQNIKPRPRENIEITAKLGQKIKDGKNVEYLIKNVIKDNRCIISDTNCHSLNDFELNLQNSWVYNDKKHTFDLTAILGQEIVDITLIKVTPEREIGKVIKDSDYVFTFSVVHFLD